MIAEALTSLFEVLTACGLVTAVTGAAAVHRFAGRAPRSLPSQPPPVTVMKPLAGDEPLLDQALATMCRQTYPTYQIVFGVKDPEDPALLAVDRLRAAFPERDVAVVVNVDSRGLNHKVCNLINMLPAAKHDILVFSDSDMHVGPDYLDNVVATLLTPGTGLVTTLCVGKPTVPGLMARLGATQITHCFLPGVLLARAIGRQDCLGTTMALTRATLERIGGLTALVDHLADDNVLGQLVQRQQMRVALADVVPATGVADRGPRGLWQHELRWNRTIRGLEPAALAASVVQFPLFWATLACVGSALSARSVGMFAFSWAIRALAAWWIDGSLRLTGRDRSPFGALPLRDILSVVEIVASFMTDNVVWRGRSLLTGKTGSLTQY